jgi:hypothetical protein
MATAFDDLLSAIPAGDGCFEIMLRRIPDHVRAQIVRHYAEPIPAGFKPSLIIGYDIFNIRSQIVKHCNPLLTGSKLRNMREHCRDSEIFPYDGNLKEVFEEIEREYNYFEYVPHYVPYILARYTPRAPPRGPPPRCALPPAPAPAPDLFLAKPAAIAAHADKDATCPITIEPLSAYDALVVGTCGHVGSPAFAKCTSCPVCRKATGWTTISFAATTVIT